MTDYKDHCHADSTTSIIIMMYRLQYVDNNWSMIDQPINRAFINRVSSMKNLGGSVKPAVMWPVFAFSESYTWTFLAGNKRVLKLVSATFLSNFSFFTKWQPFKNYEKCFLFHLKSSFRSWDIQIFVIFFPSFPHFPDTKEQMKVE